MNSYELSWMYYEKVACSDIPYVIYYVDMKIDFTGIFSKLVCGS